MPNSAILRLNSEKGRINVEPLYQRRGEVWTLEKRQLLIDSILNDYDVPKLYFHTLTQANKGEGREFDYAIIDGRQRLEAIWGFANDEFPLSDDFVFLSDTSVVARGMRYSQLGLLFPRLKIRFDSFTLPIVCVETDDPDLIEDMFSRLNEAVPLNAAEKRNAIGGPMAQCIREISEHYFFVEKVRFPDSRYQHREAAAKLLFIEFTLLFQRKIIDTKKPYLDEMVHQYKRGTGKNLDQIYERTRSTLEHLSSVFQSKDHLLRSQSVIPVYYLGMRTALLQKSKSRFSREQLIAFVERLSENRAAAATDIASANFDFLEYDRMSQQGTNDAASIRERSRIICTFLGIRIPEQWPTE